MVGFFDQLQTQPTPKPQLENLSPQMQLLERIERRAMAVVEERHPYVRDLAGRNPVIIDPYVNESPQDSQDWLDLFIVAQKNRELYARLFYLRGAGTRLVRNRQWGYVFQPVIGVNGWKSMEEYNQEKQCLNMYRDEVVALLLKTANRR